MRVRHVMNKGGPRADGSESADVQALESGQDTGAHEVQGAENEAPAETNSVSQPEHQETTAVDLPTNGTTPKKEENTTVKKLNPEITDKKDFGSLVKDSFATLLHHPERWPALNKRLSKRRDVLFGVESVVKSKGLAPVREELQKVKPAIDADLVWSLHQPLLALIVFILHERNDIHRKLVRVPELKGDICRAFSLGRPSKTAARGGTAPPKPKLERTAKTFKSYDEGWEVEEKPKKRRLTGEKLGLKKRLSEGPSVTPEEPSASPEPSNEDDGDSSEGYEPRRSSTPKSTPTAKKMKKQDGMTLHQQIAANQERDRSGKFAPGFSPGAASKLKKVVKKPGSLKPGLLSIVKKFKAKAPKPTDRGSDSPLGKRVPIKKVHSLDSSRFSSRKQHTPKCAHPNDGADATRAGAAPAAATRPRVEEEVLQDAEIAELVCALRSRGEREARALDAMGASELDERIEDLEATRRRAEAEIAQLKARKRALVGEDGGAGKEKEIGAPVRAARDTCLRAVTDMIDVLSPTLQRVPLALFNELERTGDFDMTLGALARKQRAQLQRDWDRKNELAAQAKRAEMEATYQKNKVRRHLGIPPSSEEQSTEYDAVFGTFQQKLTDLRGEMERQVKLLDDAEKSAKQAWEAYRAAA